MTKETAEKFLKLSPTGRRLVMATVIVALPFFCVFAFVGKLFQGFVEAFYYAWMEVRITVDEFREFRWRIKIAALSVSSAQCQTRD